MDDLQQTIKDRVGPIDSFYTFEPAGWREYSYPVKDDRISYYEFEYINELRSPNENSFVFLTNASGSDYSGNLQTLANYTYWKKANKATEGVQWWDVYGDHGTYAIALRCGTDDDEMWELAGCLFQECLLCDDTYSKLEEDGKNKAWCDDFHDEFCTALEGDFDLDDLVMDAASSRTLAEFIICTVNKTEWVFESGNGVPWIDVAELSKHATLAMLDEHCDCTYTNVEEAEGVTVEDQEELDRATKADIDNDMRDLG